MIPVSIASKYTPAACRTLGMIVADARGCHRVDVPSDIKSDKQVFEAAPLGADSYLDDDFGELWL